MAHPRAREARRQSAQMAPQFFHIRTNRPAGPGALRILCCFHAPLSGPFLALSILASAPLAANSACTRHPATAAKIARVLEIVRADDGALADGFAADFGWAHRCGSQVTLFLSDDRETLVSDDLLGADPTTGGWAFAQRVIAELLLPLP